MSLDAERARPPRVPRCAGYQVPAVTALASAAAVASVACSGGRAPLASLMLALTAVLLLVTGQLIATRSRHPG